jgi:branched-chain amino acid transport system substrate-binding protein
MSVIGKGIAALMLAATLIVGDGNVAKADVKIGVIISRTGAGAALGKSIFEAISLWSTEIGGEKVLVIVQDDRSDVTTATTLARRMITDDGVDVIVGPMLTPNAVAAGPVADEGQTPLFALAPVPDSRDRGRWVFNVTPPIGLMAGVVVDHMAKNSVKTVGVIGFSDTWGDQWNAALSSLGKDKQISVVADERYGRTDPSVTGQVLRLISKQPDAIFVAGSYGAAALPQREIVSRGYKGQVYHTQGIDRVSFMQLAGASAEGIIFPVGPIGIAENLPADFATKSKSVAFVEAYEKKHGANTRTSSAAHAFDVSEILKTVVPKALLVAKPGTAEFRRAIRDALEMSRDIIGSNGVYGFSEQSHTGPSDQRSSVLVTVKNGEWVPVKQ